MYTHITNNIKFRAHFARVFSDYPGRYNLAQSDRTKINEALE